MKIWFQNKRSKYKKIIKRGSGSEGEHLHSTSSVSPCSPGMPPRWEVSVANKGAQMHPNNYMTSFGHWYPNHLHQDAMPRPQMMWVDWDAAHGARLQWTCWFALEAVSLENVLNCVQMCVFKIPCSYYLCSVCVLNTIFTAEIFDKASNIFFRFVFTATSHFLGVSADYQETLHFC